MRTRAALLDDLGTGEEAGKEVDKRVVVVVEVVVVVFEFRKTLKTMENIV